MLTDSSLGILYREREREGDIYIGRLTKQGDYLGIDYVLGREVWDIKSTLFDSKRIDKSIRFKMGFTPYCFPLLVISLYLGLLHTSEKKD